MLRCVIVRIAICLALLLAARAQAAEPIDVEDLIRQGVELRRQGKDARSLPLFEEAYRLAPTPRSAAQLGLVEMALGYRLEAERHLHEALSAPHDIWVQRHRDQLEESLGKVRSAIGELIVNGSPIGAEVRVNGNRVGQLPLLAPIRLGEGPASIELRAPGYTSVFQKLSILGARRFNLRMDLHPAPVVPAAGAVAARGGDRAARPAIAAAARPPAGGPDADVVLGVQVWAAGVKPAPEPSLAARVSGGYTPAALTRGPLAVRLGAAAAFSFIDEDTGRVSFTSLLALPGLRLQLGQRTTAQADLGLGLLVVSGIRAGSVLVGPGAQTTGALSGLEVRPSVGLAVAVTPSLSLLGTVGLVWNRRPDPMLREGAFVRFDTGVGLGYRL
jgi:hypothetical protein